MRSPRDTRGQLGQTTTEWLGVMAVVATLALLVAGASKPVANQITCKATGFVGQLIGQEWGCREDKLAALPPCIVSQGDGQLKASVTVFSVKGGGKVKVVKQRRSDGKWIMTVIGGGELGGEFGTPGGGIGVDTGTSETGAGEGADGSVVVNGEYGASWVFDDEKGANDFVDIVRNKLRDKAIDASVPIVGSIGTHFFGEKRDIPSPDIEYVQGGVAGSADAEAEGGAAGLKGTFDASAAIGVRWNHQADTKTIYFNADAKAKGTAKLLAGIGLEGQVEGQIAVTYDDKTGKAVAVDVIGKGSASGVGPGVPFSGNPKEFLSKIKWTGSAGGRVEAQLHLDLTNPANAQAWDDFRANPFTGAGDLTNAFLDHGQAQVRTYRTGKDKYGLDANVKAGLEFGIDASYEGTRADLIKAWDWNPNSGWSDSATCKT